MLCSSFALAGMVEAMEETLFADPDDRLLWSAYADLLLKQGDPRSRLVQTQLALEKPGLADDERKKLQRRAQKMLKDHGRGWLGGLAPFLLDQEGVGEAGGEYRFAFQRGWLASVYVPELTVAFARALARSRQARLLRELIVGGVRPERAGEPGRDEYEFGVFAPGPDVSAGSRFPGLEALSGGLFLKNLRLFHLGHPGDGRKPRSWVLDGCADAVRALLAQAPRLERAVTPLAA
jgi:uncharacterized protein (TIGR02996 family)